VLRPGGDPLELLNRRRQMQRLAEALELNPAQQRALNEMSSQMLIKMPALVWRARASAETFAQAIVSGRDPAATARDLARSINELTGRMVRERAKFFAQLNPGQRSRAKDMFDELRQTLLGQRNAG